MEYGYVDENLGAKNSGRKIFAITSSVLNLLTEQYPDIKKQLLYHYNTYDGRSTLQFIQGGISNLLITFPFRNDS